MGIKRTQREIEATIARAMEIQDEGESPFFGMSFEEGISQALDWVLGNQENPLEDVVPMDPEDEGSVPDV